MADKLMFCTN